MTDPGAQALFNAAVTAGSPYSAGDQFVINNAFVSLRSTGWLARLDRFCFPAAASQAQGLIDWITLQNYSITGGMTFAAYLGLTGDAASGFIDTGFIPSSAGGQYTLNKAIFGVAITSTRSTGQAWCELGTSSVDAGESRIYPWYADNNQYFSNNAQFSGGTASPAAVHGIYMSNRPDSTHIVSYRNTTVIKNDAVAANSLDNVSFLVAATHGGGNFPADFSGDTIGGFWMGDGATGDADQAVLAGIISTFLSQIGVTAAPVVVANVGGGFHHIGRYTREELEGEEEEPAYTTATTEQLPVKPPSRKMRKRVAAAKKQPVLPPVDDEEEEAMMIGLAA